MGEVVSGLGFTLLLLGCLFTLLKWFGNSVFWLCLLCIQQRSLGFLTFCCFIFVALCVFVLYLMECSSWQNDGEGSVCKDIISALRFMG